MQTDAAGNANALAQITPRWEWRVFDSFPSRAIGALGLNRPDGATSLDTYLLSAMSPHNAKIRRGMIEVKLLVDVTDDGLELWRPVLKQAFPATREALAPLWSALAIPAPPMDLDTYSESQFLAEALATEAITIARVMKCRRPLTLQECIAERAFLTINQSRWETVALEHESLERLRAARASLPELALLPADYPTWLKQVVGSPAAHVITNGGIV